MPACEVGCARVSLGGSLVSVSGPGMCLGRTSLGFLCQLRGDRRTLGRLLCRGSVGVAEFCLASGGRVTPRSRGLGPYPGDMGGPPRAIAGARRPRRGVPIAVGKRRARGSRTARRFVRRRSGRLRGGQSGGGGSHRARHAASPSCVPPPGRIRPGAAIEDSAERTRGHGLDESVALKPRAVGLVLQPRRPGGPQRRAGDAVLYIHALADQIAGKVPGAGRHHHLAAALMLDHRRAGASTARASSARRASTPR